MQTIPYFDNRIIIRIRVRKNCTALDIVVFVDVIVVVVVVVVPLDVVDVFNVSPVFEWAGSNETRTCGLF